ncbi:MAG: hypothetical protein QM765_14875 [Myxococcales bacterium]
MDLQASLAPLFRGRIARRGGDQLYRDPRIELESTGATELLPGIVLVRVLEQPIPPADPVPYEVFIVVGGRHVFPAGQGCAAVLASGFVPASDHDALRMATTAVVLGAARDYYSETPIPSDAEPQVTRKDASWVVRLRTRPHASGLRVPAAPLKAYSVTVGKGVCEVQEGLLPTQRP